MAVLELQRVDEFALITLNRPEALNALNAEVLRLLAESLDRVEAGDARALLVTGAGDKAFCAGADIKELRDRTMVGHREALGVGQRLFQRLDRFPIPSVAVVNGYAFGGGLELALACTFRLATPNARMGLPEIKLGMVPGYGGTQRLPRVVGEARALELVMTGRAVDAQEALRIGLVHRVIEGDRLEGAKAFCREVTGYGLPVLRFAREAVQRALTTTLDEGLKVEADLGTLAFMTEDAREGMAAFVEKRPAKFKDR